MAILASSYFIFGLIFAFAFALFYRWEPLGYFSPGFYAVILTWPLQITGFIQDFLIYGLAGKSI